MAASATITTNVTTGGGTNALGVYFDRKVIHSLQPNLYFEQLADVVTVGQGNFTSRFAMFDQIATSSVTQLTTEGDVTLPTPVGVTLTTADLTPTQYAISVELSDLVVLTSFVELINTTSVEVGYAMARKIDTVIQTTANAGTNVIYGGSKASRSALAAGDVIDATLVLKANQKLVKGSAPAFSDGHYRAIATVEQIADLKSNYSVGQWVDVSKYAQPENILNGEVGKLHGIRIMQSPNVATFSSTTTVHPMLVAGQGGFRVAYWLPSKVKTYINHPEDSTIANPVGQKGNVGAKVNIGVARTQEARLVRIETGTTTSL